MKYVVKGCNTIMYVGMVIALLSLWNTYVSMTAVSHISFSIDNRISVVTQKKIKQFVHTNLHANLSEEELHASIKKQFSCIKSVSIAYTPPNNMCVICKAHTPCCLLNQDLVLTTEAIPVEKKAFKPHEFKRLHTILLNAQLLNQKAVLQQCIACIAQLPSEVFNTHTMLWVSDVEVWLHDTVKNVSIVFDAHNPPNDALLAQCNDMKKELHKTSQKNSWIMDVRFKNQIIVNKGVKGERYG